MSTGLKIKSDKGPLFVENLSRKAWLIFGIVTSALPLSDDAITIDATSPNAPKTPAPPIVPAAVPNALPKTVLKNP